MSNDTSYLLSLNEAQREAVEYCDGPSLVIAGAGSGKTRVLVYKLVHLLHLGYDPSRLMALTFTNKAAREMRERISRIAGSGARHIMMGTFHSIFARILREHAHLLGYGSNFSIYDTDNSKRVLKELIKEMALEEKAYQIKRVSSLISKAKNSLVTPEIYLSTESLKRRDRAFGIPAMGQLYLRYAERLKANNAMDFDDLLLQTNILMRDHPDVLAYWQERIDYLLIDEYQDTNLAQYTIARKLVEGKGALQVVGDDAQSIYSFRGANIEHILNFTQVFPTAKIFKLEQNYRSTHNIVKVASALIHKNRGQLHKEAISMGEEGEPILLHRAPTADLEAMWVCNRIEALRQRYGASYDQFAVLYRTNAQSRTLEQHFIRNDIPFRIWGGFSFFRHKEIQDILAYLRLMVNARDEEALLRIINYPKRNIGDATVDKLKIWARGQGFFLEEMLGNPDMLVAAGLNKRAVNQVLLFGKQLEEMRQLALNEETSLYDRVEQVVHRSRIYHDLMADHSPEGVTRQQNMQELLVSVEEYMNDLIEQGEEPTLHRYVSEIALYTDQDKDRADEEQVMLMTIHASKGLEFDHVFVVGLEEGLLPTAIMQDNDVEEERRLFYVAITRAAKTCYISFARERLRYGLTQHTTPSSFLKDLPEDLLSPEGYLPGAMGAKGLPRSFPPSSMPSAGARYTFVERREKLSPEEERSQRHERIGDLEVGCRVLHPRFGEGEVLLLEGEGAQAQAIVRFGTKEVKKLLLRFAKLEVVS